MEIFVIYKQPSDYPHSFVLRRQVVHRDGAICPDPLPLALALSGEPGALEAVRLSLPPGLVKVQSEDPDPCIYEVWI